MFSLERIGHAYLHVSFRVGCSSHTGGAHINRLSLTLVGALVAGGAVAIAQDHPGSDHPGAGGMDPQMMQAMMAWQAYATPGAEQAWLAEQAGTYVTKAEFRTSPNAPWMESEGVVVRTMDMGGRFLVEDFTGTMMGMPFRGQGTTGWDNGRSLFVTTWYDNMSTGIAQGVGHWNADRTRINWEITQTDPMKKMPITSKAEWWWKADGTQVFDSWMPTPTGEQFHAMRIQYIPPAVPIMGGMEHPTGGEHPHHHEHPGGHHEHHGGHHEHPGQ